MTEKLALYAFDSCPYCRRVFAAAKALELTLEVRDIHRDPSHRSALIEATGRTTVPVLRIEEDERDVRWLPESRDIVDYLYARYGEGKAPPRFGLAAFDGYIRMAMWALLLLGAVLGDGRRDPLWLAACLLGAVRAFSTARRCGSPWQYGIGGVFALGAVSIALTMAGVASLPWWYAAYALVAVMVAVALWQRLRMRRR